MRTGTSLKDRPISVLAPEIIVDPAPVAVGLHVVASGCQGLPVTGDERECQVCERVPSASGYTDRRCLDILAIDRGLISLRAWLGVTFRLVHESIAWPRRRPNGVLHTGIAPDDL